MPSPERVVEAEPAADAGRGLFGKPFAHQLPALPAVVPPREDIGVYQPIPHRVAVHYEFDLDLAQARALLSLQPFVGAVARVIVDGQDAVAVAGAGP